MRRLLRALPLLPLLLSPAACAPRGGVPADPGAGGDESYVVVISFDGMRHDYVDRVETPGFDRVIRGGVRADGLVPVFPSKTFPNHYSIATGMYAGRHGLVDNQFYDPALDATYSMRDRAAVEDGRWYGGEPIWVTAERQGVAAAAYFFVGTEAAIGGVRPSHYRVYDGSVPNEARVAQALDWLRLPPEERPRLILLYFSDVDDAGHRHGPDAPQVDSAVQRVDRALGQLLDGVARLPIADRVHYVLVSDHGMAAIDSTRVEYLDDHADLDGVRAFGGGPYVTLWFAGDTARLRRVHDALEGGLRRAEVWTRDEIPARYHYGESDRAGDLLVLADAGQQVVVRGRGRAWSGGAHGYAPEHRDLHGVFFAAGPRIRAGLRVPAFENVHVYPLVAHLLGLEPNTGIDGRLDVLRPILR